MNNTSSNFIISYGLFFFEIFKPLLSRLVSLTYPDLRFFFFLIILIFNIFFVVLFFINKKHFKIFYISCLSLFMFSESIHIPEIFRMSTGPVIGLIPLIYFLKNFKFTKVFLIIFTIFLSFTWHGGRHNYSYDYYYPKDENNLALGTGYFKFQKLPKKIIEFYNNFEISVNKINRKYIVNRYYNFPRMPIISLLSNSKGYQLGSFQDKRVKEILKKRNDIDLDIALNEVDDLIIFYPSKSKQIPEHLKNNFFLAEELNFPYIIGASNLNLKYLLILLPIKVKEKI